MVLGPPPIFIDCSVYIPTPGVPPTCSSRFHPGLLHIILDERLVISWCFLTLNRVSSGYADIYSLDKLSMYWSTKNER